MMGNKAGMIDVAFDPDKPTATQLTSAFDEPEEDYVDPLRLEADWAKENDVDLSLDDKYTAESDKKLLEEGDEVEKEAENKPEDEAKPDDESAKPEIEGKPDEEKPPVADKTPETKKQTPMIPKPRLDEEIVRNENLQRELATLRTQIKREEESKGRKLPVTREELKAAAEKALDNDTDAFAEILETALGRIQDKAIEEAIARSTTATTQLTAAERAAQERKSEAVAQAALYPVLDPESDQFDQALVDEVIDYRIMYEERGYSPRDAIQKAVKLVANDHGLSPVKADAPPTQKTAAPPAQPPKAVVKAPVTPLKQPAAPSARTEAVTTTADTDKTYSQDEWEAMPEAKRRAILGM